MRILGIFREKSRGFHDFYTVFYLTRCNETNKKIWKTPLDGGSDTSKGIDFFDTLKEAKHCHPDAHSIKRIKSEFHNKEDYMEGDLE